MGFGDILSGFAQAGHEHQTNLIQFSMQQARDLASTYSRLMQDENYPAEQRQQFGQAFQDLTTSDPFKIPQVVKKYKDMQVSVKPPTQMRTVQPPTPPEVDQNQSIPPNPGMPLGREFSNIPPPVPPPEQQEYQPPNEMRPLMQPRPFSEALRMKQQEEQMKYETTTKPLQMLKTAAPKQLGKTTVVDPDGTRHTVVLQQQAVRNPDGSIQQDEGGFPVLEVARLKDPDALPPFAQRLAAGVAVPAVQAINALKSGAAQYNDNMGVPYTPERLQKLMDPETGLGPQVSLHPVDSTSNRWIPVNDRMGLFHANGRIYRGSPFEEANMAQEIGQEASTLTKTRTNWRETGLDAQGFTQWEPFDTTTNTALGAKISLPKGQTPPGYEASATAPVAAPTPPTPAGAAPGTATPAAPSAAPPKPPAKAPLSETTTTPPATKANTRRGALNPGAQKDWQQTLRSVRPAAQILYGDANNPDFESLQSFATVADSPERRALVGAAAKTIIQKLGRTGTMAPEAAMGGMGVSASTGGILQLITNYLGLPAKQAASEVGVVENAMKPLTPQEVRMVGRIMAAYGTIVGIRKLTSGGAYQFSTEAMEREVPIPGMTGVNSSQSYYNKLAQLGEELTSATRQAPPEMVPEYPAWEKNTAYLNAKGRGWGIAQDANKNYLFRHEDGKWYDQNGKAQ